MYDFLCLEESLTIFSHSLSKSVSSLTHPIDNWGFFDEIDLSIIICFLRAKEIAYFTFKAFGSLPHGLLEPKGRNRFLFTHSGS